MAVLLEQFVKHLKDSGVLASDTLQDFIPPKASPKDAEELARELILHKKLTKFQAEQPWLGKGKSLVLGNYVLVEKIGQGGMGAVYKAEHRRLKRLVAIKMLPPDMLKNTTAAARFQRETEAAAKLRHPNIVATDDADEANGVHFMVMECVEGSDLSALVKKNGPLPVAQSVNYILQAARGLEFAHSRAVIHRDIKPGNLLLGKDGVVKILDMGLARIEGDTAGRAELTGTFAVMGTVDYMAPEQAVSTKRADARADIYSLGCSLFYLLTGKAAYVGESLTAKLIAHQNHPIPDLRSVRADVPEQVEAVFRRMVAKTIADRYQTMSEVIAALEACTSGQAVNPPSFAASDTGLTNFLKEMEVLQAAEAVPKQVASANVGNKRTKKLLIGGVLLSAILLSVLVFSSNAKDGTLIIQVNQPDAEVQVLNHEGAVELTRKGDKRPITMSVAPGKHRLKVQKDGFEIFTEDFEIKNGGEESITAKLVPVGDKPAVAGTKQSSAFATPGFDQWVKKVAAMSAEKQVEVVSKKLVELNPGFDGNVASTIENGIATDVKFRVDIVTDISPVRALTGLTSLRCIGSEYGKFGQLSDLKPIEGMRLTTLVCSSWKTVDLSPLRGMPLTNLDCTGSQVADLSPLRGMPLHELRCSLSNVTELTLLKGMDLTYIEIDGTQVSDLSPLKGMPLTTLSCRHTPVSDLSSIRGMKLTGIFFQNTNVSAISVLIDMPLRALDFDFKPERDTEILRSIKTLETINGRPAAEFWREVEEQHGKKQ